MKVFKFRIFHCDKDGLIYDYTEHQERYVLAETEEEAEKKLDEYRKKMVANGFSDFRFLDCPKVDTENVIV